MEVFKEVVVLCFVVDCEHKNRYNNKQLLNVVFVICKINVEVKVISSRILHITKKQIK